MAKKKEQNKKAKTVLETAFNNDVSPFNALNVKDELIQHIMELKKNKDSLRIMLDVKDVEEKRWMNKEHFVKIFYFELKHVEEYYSLSKGDKHFLLDLGDFLMWQTNLLVDEEDNPLNQKQIAERLGIDPRTVRRNMKSLEERFLIYQIKLESKVFYIINPYIMFIGKDINIAIPKLFDELDYLNSSKVDSNNNRSNRKKEQQKRITVG